MTWSQLVAPLFAVFLLAGGAAASVLLQQNVALEPAVGNPPATLAAGPSGSTSLGASATSAVTTLASTPITGTFSADTLQILSGSNDVNVRVQLISESAVLGDSLTLELDDGDTSALQVDILDGIVLQTIGDPLQLTAGGDPMTIHVSGTEALLSADTVYTLQIVFTSPIGGDVQARYDYRLTVT